MSDQQPPHKKSRFFAEGKQVLKSFLNRHVGKDENPKPPAAAHQSTSVSHGVSSQLRPSALSLGKANSIGTALSTGITPTANAFRELSFHERDERRKAIYGASNVPRFTRDGHQGSSHQPESEEMPDGNADLPWQRGNIVQQSEQRQVSLVKASYDAAQQSQFTFRAPAQPNVPRFPFQSNRAGKSGPGAGHIFGDATSQHQSHTVTNGQTAKVSRAPSQTPFLNVPKQRYTEPSRPHVPNFPHIHRPHLDPGKASNGPRMNTAPAFGPSWGVDVDRDSHGRRVQESYSCFTNLPSHAGSAQPGRVTPHRSPAARPHVPENALSSPDRVERAVQFAGRKRKRGIAILPPPAYIFNRKNDPSFNVFHGMLLYPELCFHLASHLPLEDLVSLYAISKDFHTIIDTRFTTVILSQATKKAPTSSQIFPFRCYGHLCRNDPAARIAHPDPQKAAQGIARRIPSFKWLRMVIYREKAVHAIMVLFAEHGIPLPRRCEQSIKKLWFIMDIPDNARRIGYVHNTQLITDADLYFAVCFSVKLDMLLHDPVASTRFIEGRRMIMSQPTMSMLLKLLNGEALVTRWDLMQEYVRWKYDAPAGENIPEDEVLFGVPKKEWGVIKKEFWANEHPTRDGEQAKSSEVLLRPDQLVLRESIKRGLRFAGHYVEFMQHGYVHPRSLENFEPRVMSRRAEELKDDEYGLDDVVVGVRSLRVENGGDLYLDLGQPSQGSAAIIRREEVSPVEAQHRIDQQSFITQMYADSFQERQALGLD